MYKYAGHPTTDAWCMSWRFDDEPVEIWKMGEPLPDRVRKHVEAGGEFHAHNANFEWCIWNAVMAPRYGWPKLDIEQCRCTAAMCAAMGLPRSLEDAAPAAGLAITKDPKGKYLMLQMCRPREIKPDGTIVWWDEPEKLERLYAYCIQDTEVESQLEKRILPLSPSEQELWILDQRINARGIMVDLPQVRAIESVVEHYTPKLDHQMRLLTDGDVTACSQVQRILKWLNQNGVDTKSVNKETITDLLEEDLPEHIEQVLMLRLEASKVSTSKLKTMQTAASGDSRIRGVFLFNGASTGRWSSLRVQLHNLPRPLLKAKVIEQVLPMFRQDPATASREIELIHGSPIQVASDCLRGVLVAAPGHDFIAADFANIEGRVLAVLSGQKYLIDLFRVDGPVYEAMAAAIYRVPVESIGEDSEERRLGKQAVLGCGYGMGKKKFWGTCKKYNIKISPAMAELAVDTYRDKNDRIKGFWYAAEAAAIRAVEHPGQVTKIVGVPDHGIRFKKSGSFLFCKLPSGRKLCFCYPKIVQKMTPWDELRPALICKGVNSVTKKWEEYNLYGGLLVENIVQAVARDLLGAAMLRVKKHGYGIPPLHVHDEVVCEVQENFGTLDEFEKLMGALPAWAANWPVSAKGWRGKRFRK